MSEYDQFALLYDWEHAPFNDDLLMYRNFAQRCDGAVLDVGCGAGRVTLALAQAGLPTLGIDTSNEMLRLAQAHAAARQIGHLARFERRDVRRLDLESEFALAVFALNGFLHLLTPADQRTALRAIRRALLPGGLLIIDTPNPHTVFVPDRDGQWMLRSRFRSSDGQDIECLVNTQTDLAEQMQQLELRYDQMTAGSSLVRRVAIRIGVRFVYQYEMIALLESCGFELDAVYGSYDLDPYQADSAIMLFVAYRPA